MRAQIQVHEFMDLSHGRRQRGEVMHNMYGEWKISQLFSLRMQIVVRVVSALERLSLSSNKSDQTRLEAALLTRLRGFSRIVDTLVAERIPIVGHNCLMDFMLIYQGTPSDSQYIALFYHDLGPSLGPSDVW